ncbi:hypothetical protein AB0L97_21795 [Nocardia sp. NPDC051911]
MAARDSGVADAILLLASDIDNRVRTRGAARFRARLATTHHWEMA